MVDSRQQITTDSKASEEDQLRRVAAYAGLVAYLKIQEEESGHISDKYAGGAQNKISGWATASLMEGVGEKAMRNPPPSKKTLWKNLIPFILMPTVLSAAFCPEVCARSFFDRFKLPGKLHTKDTRGSTGNFSNHRIQPAQPPQPVFPVNPEPFLRSNYPLKPVHQLSEPHAFLYDRRESDLKRKTVYVRVGLITGASKVEFDTFDGAEIINLKDNSKVALVKPEGRFVVSALSRGSESYLSLAPKSLVDESLIVTGPELNQKIQKVSFTPTAVTRPMVPFNSPGFLQTSNFRVNVLVENGGLPEAYLSGRSTPDLTTIAGILIAPKNYTHGKSSASFSLGGRAYRGALLIAPRVVKTRRGDSRLVLNAINVLDIEDYLFSVLPSEMPPSWPIEALKAQAIASRSYVMANLGKFQKDGYDVKASIMDQAYKGIVKETDRTNRAVTQTSGMVMKQEGKIVPAFFHSSGGGYTEVSQNVWTKELPFLNAVPDFDTSSPHQNWQRAFTPCDLEKKLALPAGDIQALFAIDRSPSKRVKIILVVTSNGCDLVKGVKLRSLLGLPSTNFNISYKDGAYLFKGRGFGHGLGLSQWGARVLSSHGYNAAQILKYYYKDVTFGQIFEEPAL